MIILAQIALIYNMKPCLFIFSCGLSSWFKSATDYSVYGNQSTYGFDSIIANLFMDICA